jgi:hypothetical protein
MAGVRRLNDRDVRRMRATILIVLVCIALGLALGFGSAALGEAAIG